MKLFKKLPTTVGIEYTFIIDPAQEFVDHHKVYNTFQKRATSNWIKRKAHLDGSDSGKALEVPSPVAKSYRDIKCYHDELMQHASKFPLLRWHATESLGGGHIHLGLQKQFKDRKVKEIFLKNLYTEITNHPELQWAVNCPLDNINANSLLDRKSKVCLDDYPEYSTSWMWSELRYLRIQYTGGHNQQYQNTKNCREREILKHIAKEKGITNLTEREKIEVNAYERVYHQSGFYSLGKNVSVQYRELTQTVEFRMFDSARDWTEQELYLDIALAIFMKCKKDAEAGILYPFSKMTLEKMSKMSLETSWKNFVAHMKSLGINKSRITNQRSNMEVRFSKNFGKAYLK